ncbi:hypothetical protein [Neobacillus sp. D3-1R]|uniref:hypothetical protein n=1 Tax=Neobacillus sp. D3-1R TaxID=3445778 RepID=UPI003FA0152B
MNVLQVVMLIIVCGFILSILKIDQILKKKEVDFDTRRQVSKFILMFGVIVQCLLTIVLVKYSL